MSNAAATVIDLEKKRDALQAKHEANEALRDQIVDLKKKQESIDAFVATLAEKTDEELEALHLALMAERSAIKPKITALAQLRSSRAKIAANRETLKHLTPAEILAALSPEQRAALSKK